MAKRKVSQIFNVQEHLIEFTPIEQILDTEVTIMSYEKRAGQNGEYVVMSIAVDGVDEIYKVPCGGFLVKGFLNACRSSDFPIRLMIKKQGRMYVPTDVD